MTAAAIAFARATLKAANVPPEAWDQVTGFGLRSGCESLPNDTLLNKLASGALSIVGVCGVVFGTDSWQHSAGHNRSDEVPDRLKFPCSASYMAGEVL